jgi:hypothetical protein
MGQRKHKKRVKCEGGHFMVLVENENSAPGELYESYIPVTLDTQEKVEQNFLERLFAGDFPNGSTAYIYECNLVSMVGGGHGPQQ